MFHLCHRFPVLSLAGGCFPPSPFTSPPVPIGLRLTLCRWGGALGGRCRSIICCYSFSSALVTGSCVLERPRAWRRALWGLGVPIASALSAVGRGLEWGAGGGGFGVTPPLQRGTAAGIVCVVLGGGTLNQGVCVAALPIRGTHWGGAISRDPIPVLAIGGPTGVMLGNGDPRIGGLGTPSQCSQRETYWRWYLKWGPPGSGGLGIHPDAPQRGMCWGDGGKWDPWIRGFNDPIPVLSVGEPKGGGAGKGAASDERVWGSILLLTIGEPIGAVL